MAEDRKETPRCELDSNGSLKLSCLLRSFNAPISEEQAWAVCFQTAKCMVNEWNSDSSTCYCLSDTGHVFIHKDGSIHRSTLRLPIIDGTTRQLAASEYMLVSSLGLTIFYALDYGLCDDEERKLSPPLELLIDRMTSADSEADNDANSSSGDDGESQNADEGIEQDSGEDDRIDTGSDDGKQKNGLTLVKVMEMCAGHLSCPGQADCHYKAVCRALVAEALELSSFLEKISNGTKELLQSAPDESDSGTTLDNLKFQDWARLWVQVIQELRQGVKLKKVDAGPHLHPIEYELTPYEMLLDDIRSRRYKLNKVMVNGDIPPRVKKDAHALILEFIRSRPPLVPVSKRKLPPTPPRQLSLYEKLMASIKQQHKLKPTPRDMEVETSRTKLEDTDITPQPHRRLIKVDLSLRLSSSFEDDDMDDLPPSPAEEPQSLPVCSENRKQPLVRSNSLSSTSNGSERRHSISVCESPPKPCNGTLQNKTLINGHFRNTSDRSSSHSKSDYWMSSQWRSLECLSLTLEEVVHIRNVLTKAELESLIVAPALYDDILKGKVCFTCKHTRFSFFGPWGVKCKMCERTVCDKCSSKMRIPTEHFARIPVYMLSPTPSPPPEEDSSSHTFWRLSEVLTFSSSSSVDQTTPKLSRQVTVSDSHAVQKRQKFRHSESVHVLCGNKEKSSFISTKKAPLQRSKTIQESDKSPKEKSQEEKAKGPLVSVCRECKVMVCSIITASREKISPQEKRKRNSRTWPQQRAVSCAATSCMSPVAETPPSSPDELFVDYPIENVRHHVSSVV